MRRTVGPLPGSIEITSAPPEARSDGQTQALAGGGRHRLHMLTLTPSASARASGLAPASYIVDDNGCNPGPRGAFWGTEANGRPGSRRSQDGGREREARPAPAL